MYARGSGDFASFGLGTSAAPFRDAFFPNFASALFFFGSVTSVSLAAAVIDCSDKPTATVPDGVCRLLVPNIRRKLFSFSLADERVVGVAGETSAPTVVCSVEAARGLEKILLFQDESFRTRGTVDDRVLSEGEISSGSVVKTASVGVRTDPMSSIITGGGTGRVFDAGLRRAWLKRMRLEE